MPTLGGGGSLATLVARLQLDNADFVRGMEQSRKQIVDLEKTARRLKVAASATAVAATALGASVVKVASESEQARIRLDSLFGSAQEGAAAFAALRDTAAELPFTFAEVLQAGTGLSVAVDDAVELRKRLGQIAEVSARFGIGLQEAAAQFVRFSTAGAASADLFRERGVNAMLGIQAGAQTSAAESMRLWERFFQRIQAEGSMATDRLAGSFQGITSMLEDRWRDFRQLVADAGFFDAVKGAMRSLQEQMDALADSGALDRLAKRVSDTLTTMLRGLGELLKSAATVIGVVESNPAMAQFGVVGFFLFGKKGLLIGAGLGAKFEQIKRAVDDLGDVKGLKDLDTKMRALVDAFDPLNVQLQGTEAGASAFADALRIVGNSLSDFEVQVSDAAGALGAGGGGRAPGTGGLAGGARTAAEALRDLEGAVPTQLGQEVFDVARAWENAARVFQQARDNIELPALPFGELVEDAGKLPVIFETAGGAASNVAAEIDRAARGALDLASAFGLVGDRLGRVLGSLTNIGRNIGDLVKAIGSGGSIAGPIGGIVSGVASVVSGLFGKGERQKFLEATAVPLAVLADDAERLQEIATRFGQEMVGQLRALSQFADVGKKLQRDELAGLADLLGAVGVDLAELSDAAQAFGLDISELMRVLVTGEGNRKVAAAQLQRLQEAIGLLPNAAQEAEDALAAFARSLSSFRSETQDMLDVFDVSDPGLRIQAFIGDLQRSLTGNEFAALERTLNQINLAILEARRAGEGIEGLEGFIDSVIEDAFDLAPAEVRGAIADLDRFVRDIFDRLTGASRAAAPRGGIDRDMGRFEPPPPQTSFAQRSVITEIQGAELVALNRSQLVRLEQLIGQGDRRDFLIADLPSNIRDGVDLHLADALELEGV